MNVMKIYGITFGVQNEGHINLRQIIIITVIVQSS